MLLYLAIINNPQNLQNVTLPNNNKHPQNLQNVTLPSNNKHP